MTPEFLAALVALIVLRVVEMSPRAKRLWDRLDEEGKLGVVALLCFVLPFVPALVQAAYGVDVVEAFSRAAVVTNFGLGLSAFLVSTQAHDLLKFLRAMPVRVGAK